jgi:hypothetical protein
MGEVDEIARLWKVNRTIHELVKDRVSDKCEPSILFNLTNMVAGVFGIGRRAPHGPAEIPTNVRH